MTLTESESPRARRRPPAISLEWRDVTIQLRLCAAQGEQEHEYQELWPRLSEKLVSADCLPDGKQKKKEDGEKSKESRGGSPEGGHTLAHLLSQGNVVNSRGRREGSVVTSEGGGSDEAGPDLLDTQGDIKMSKLIELSSGGKGCHICGKVFGDSTRIKRHLLSHSKEKPYKCHICGWGFHQKCNMERHLASHTREGEGHACPRCNSWFTTKSVLSLHLRDAHGERYIGKKDLQAAAAEAKKEKVKVEEVKAEEVKTEEVKVEEEPEEEPQLVICEPEYEAVQEQKYEPMEITFPKQLEAASLKMPGIRKGTFGPNEGSLSHGSPLDELTCHLCGKTFVKKTNLKHHLMLHRGEKPWKCHICAYRFVQKCNLKKHIDTHSTGSYKCPQCDIMFASKGAVAGHMSIVHLGAEDNAPSKNIAEADDGEEEEMEIPAPVVPLIQEAKKPSSPAMLWWKHLEPDSSPKTSEAGEGDKPGPASTIVPKTTLNIPKVTPSPVKPEAKPLACTKCSKIFVTKVELDKHMLVHNATTKPYACPVCGWRFHLLHNMKRHLDTHEESGDIEAGTAEELLAAVEATASKTPTLASPRSLPTVDGMVSPASLASSDAAEQGSLRCNICSKVFQETVGLSRHMEVHSVDRPFACPICAWRFKQEVNMKRHMLTHSGAKPYTCDFCDKSYTDNYSLKTHVAKAHPEVASSIPNMLTNPNRAKKSGPHAREVNFTS